MRRCLGCGCHKAIRRARGIYLCRYCYKDSYTLTILHSEYSQLTKIVMLRGAKNEQDIPKV